MPHVVRSSARASRARLRGRRRPAARALLGAVAGAALLAPALPPPALLAQDVTASVDVGGVLLRYADTLRATAATLSPAVHVGLGPASVTAFGTGSRLDVGGWSVQGGVLGAATSPAFGPVNGEIVGSAAGSAHRDGTRTGETRGGARLHVAGWIGGLWAGGGIGRTNDGVRWRDVRHTEGGVWARHGPAAFSATVTPTVVDDTLRYTDGEALLQLVLGRADVDLTAGLRSGAAVLANLGGDRAWGGASVTVWMTPRAGLVAAAGTYPVSPTQGFPGGRYATLGVRLATRRARPAEGADAAAAVAAAPAERTEELAGFAVTPAGGGRRTLRVRAPAARTLEVAGDFTAWQPVPMVRGADGWWAVTLPIPAGVSQLNLRLDGSAWRAPPGLPTVSDEFGGTVGLLVIE